MAQGNGYKFAVLSPRPQDAERNDQVFTAAEPIGILGIEVTVPALAERCALGNIDPQHTGGDPNRAAIELAVMVELPPVGATLATVRSDLDAIGAMAVFNLRRQGIGFLDEAEQRLLKVAEADRFAKGGWPGQRELPTMTDPWPEATTGVEDSQSLAAIAAAVSDFRIDMVERVAWMEQWLLTGEEPTNYRDKVEAERLEMIEALERGYISVGIAAQRIAGVTSTHRAGTMLGYMQCPVVVVFNPEFRLGGGDPHRKFTICQFQNGYVDMSSIVAELTGLEDGWGGSQTIIGSPQGVGSTLLIDDVVDIVYKHLSDRYIAPGEPCPECGHEVGMIGGDSHENCQIL